MDGRATEQGHPDTAKTVSVERTAINDQTHRVRRPFLTSTGRNIRNILFAAAGITGVLVGGSNILQNSQAQGHEPASAPPAPAKVIEGQSLTPSPEVKANIIKVGDLHPGKPPTKNLNGTVTIIIDKEDNLPVPRTSPLIDGADNATSWLQISKVNNQSITKAADSNGQVELVLTNPLITPTDSGIGSWVTMVGADEKPLYLFAGQETAGIVKEAPRGGKEDVFSPVPPTANALDFGKVSFQDTPQPTTAP